jgi:hypothetical protein
MQAAGSVRLHTVLCVVVLATMVLAILYTVWIAASNFSRIGV